MQPPISEQSSVALQKKEKKFYQTPRLRFFLNYIKEARHFFATPHLIDQAVQNTEFCRKTSFVMPDNTHANRKPKRMIKSVSMRNLDQESFINESNQEMISPRGEINQEIVNGWNLDLQRPRTGHDSLTHYFSSSGQNSVAWLESNKQLKKVLNDREVLLLHAIIFELGVNSSAVYSDCLPHLTETQLSLPFSEKQKSNDISVFMSELKKFFNFTLPRMLFTLVGVYPKLIDPQFGLKFNFSFHTALNRLEDILSNINQYHESRFIRKTLPKLTQDRLIKKLKRLILDQAKVEVMAQAQGKESNFFTTLPYRLLTDQVEQICARYVNFFNQEQLGLPFISPLIEPIKSPSSSPPYFSKIFEKVKLIILEGLANQEVDWRNQVNKIIMRFSDSFKKPSLDKKADYGDTKKWRTDLYQIREVLASYDEEKMEFKRSIEKAELDISEQQIEAKISETREVLFFSEARFIKKISQLLALKSESISSWKDILAQKREAILEETQLYKKALSQKIKRYTEENEDPLFAEALNQILFDWDHDVRTFFTPAQTLRFLQKKLTSLQANRCLAWLGKILPNFVLNFLKKKLKIDCRYHLYRQIATRSLQGSILYIQKVIDDKFSFSANLLRCFQLFLSGRFNETGVLFLLSLLAEDYPKESKKIHSMKTLFESYFIDYEQRDKQINQPLKESGSSTLSTSSDLSSSEKSIKNSTESNFFSMMRPSSSVTKEEISSINREVREVIHGFRRATKKYVASQKKLFDNRQAKVSYFSKQTFYAPKPTPWIDEQMIVFETQLQKYMA